MGFIRLVTSPWIAFTVEPTKPPFMDGSHREIRQVIISVVGHQVKWLCAMEDGTQTGEIMHLGFYVYCFQQKNEKNTCCFSTQDLVRMWEKTPWVVWAVLLFMEENQLTSRFGYIVLFHELQGLHIPLWLAGFLPWTARDDLQPCARHWTHHDENPKHLINQAVECFHRYIQAVKQSVLVSHIYHI